MLLFIGDRSRQSSSASDATASLLSCPTGTAIESLANPLFQRWNLYFRSSLKKFSYNPQLAPAKIFRILVLRKLQAAPTSPMLNQEIISYFHNESQHFFNELSLALRDVGIRQFRSYDKTVIEEIDIASISLQQQVAIVAKSHLMIGLHGSGINALSMHMPIGSVDCCSVIEIYDQGNMRPLVKGIRNAAQAMGHSYSRVEIALHHHEHAASEKSSGSIRKAEVKKVLDTVEKSIAHVARHPTCVLPEAIQADLLKSTG
jgi:hypothetical protein